MVFWSLIPCAPDGCAVAGVERVATRAISGSDPDAGVIFGFMSLEQIDCLAVLDSDCPVMGGVFVLAFVFLKGCVVLAIACVYFQLRDGGCVFHGRYLVR